MFAPRGWLKRSIYRRIYRSIQSSAFFDSRWYRTHNLGFFERFQDPIWHYIEKGWRRGLNPSERFDSEFYIAHNRDVQEARINPLFHYIEYGAPERRAPIRPGRVLIDQIVAETAALRLFRDDSSQPRITLLLDDNSAHHPVLCDQPTVQLASHLASELNVGLRVVSCRTTRPFVSEVARGVDFLSIDKTSLYGDIPFSNGELWLSTSWSTYLSLQRSKNPVTNVLLLDSCDLCLLPSGQGRVAMEELLTNQEASIFLTRPELARHLRSVHGISLPDNRVLSNDALVKDSGGRSKAPSSPKVLSFLATAHRDDTLFSRGVDLLELALAKGLLKPKEWEIVFFGSPLPSLNLLNSAQVVPREITSIEHYMRVLEESDCVVALDSTSVGSPVIRDALGLGVPIVTTPTAHKATNDDGLVFSAQSNSLEDLLTQLSAALSNAANRSHPPKPVTARNHPSAKISQEALLEVRSLLDHG